MQQSNYAVVLITEHYDQGSARVSFMHYIFAMFDSTAARQERIGY